tara:strand:+ start:304 stop:519 length:216 start_codon:yes stop_codon:yes gene_type:complete
MSWEYIIKTSSMSWENDICEICKNEGSSNFEAVKTEKDGHFKVIRYCRTCNHPEDITEGLITEAIRNRNYR